MMRTVPMESFTCWSNELTPTIASQGEAAQDSVSLIYILIEILEHALSAHDSPPCSAGPGHGQVSWRPGVTGSSITLPVAPFLCGLMGTIGGLAA